MIRIMSLLSFLLSFFALLGCGEKDPIAEAGPDRTAEVGEIVQLDGSESEAADEFEWIFIDKPDGSLAQLTYPQSVTPVFEPDMAGIYKVGLVVRNSAGQSKLDIVTIEAKGKNHPPIVQLKADPDGPIFANDSVLLQASVKDEAMEKATYRWKVSGGTIAGSGPSATWTAPPKPGTYKVTLIVTDDADQSTEGNLDLTVRTRNLVKPGVAIGSYTVGITFAEFKKQHGPPNRITGVVFEYRNGMGGSVSDENGDDEIDDQELVFQVAATKPFDCASARGATFGDPFKVWTDEFGEPDVVFGDLYIWERLGLVIGGKNRNETQFIGVVQGDFVAAAPPIGRKPIEDLLMQLFKTMK